MSLAENIRRLTEDHAAEYHGKAGTVPALLDQLDDAVTDSLGGRGRSSGAAPLPFSADASELRASIHSEIREYHAEHFPGDMAPSAKAAVAKWAALDDADQYLEHATLDWCDLIEALIAPQKPRRRLEGIPCPACSQTRTEERDASLTAGIWARNEEFLPIGEWDVSCGSCGALWRGMEIGWLLVALRARGYADTPSG